MEITGMPGEIYEQHLVPAVMARWTPEFVELMSLRFGDRALDVACGTGVVTRELPYRVGKTGRVVVLSVWRSTRHNSAFRALEEALARRIGPAKAGLPPYRLGDAQLIRSMLTTAGFKEVHIEAVVKFSRWHTAEHFVRSMVAGAPTMLGELAGQGPAVLDALIAEVAEATSDFVDDRGWAAPQTSHLITAIA